jgi:hypothetical protein
MSSTKKNNPQMNLFEDDKQVHKRRTNQKNFDDIYLNDLDFNDLLPAKYRENSKIEKDSVK